MTDMEILCDQMCDVEITNEFKMPCQNDICPWDLNLYNINTLAIEEGFVGFIYDIQEYKDKVYSIGSHRFKHCYVSSFFGLVPINSIRDFYYSSDDSNQEPQDLYVTHFAIGNKISDSVKFDITMMPEDFTKSLIAINDINRLTRYNISCYLNKILKP